MPDTVITLKRIENRKKLKEVLNCSRTRAKKAAAKNRYFKTSDISKNDHGR